MNDGKYDEIAALLAYNQPLFQALGDVARQEIVILLASEEHLSVGELARRTRLSRPAVSHHLRILKEAGLLYETREGTRRYYHPSFSGGVGSMKRLVTRIQAEKELL